MDSGAIFRLIQKAEDFKELEKGLLQLAFALVRQWMVAVLESLDQELAATREPSLELIRSDVRTLEIVGGPIQFSRRYYRDRATGQYRYLLDEALGLEGRQRRSPLVEQMAIELATKFPYREVERFLREYLFTRVSHQTAHARVQEAGHAREEEQAAMQAAMEATGELPPPEGRVVEYLFLEADGLSIALQREGERRTELKLGIVHEGWEEDPPGSGRYRLMEKQVFGGLGESRTFWASASLALHQRYALEKVGQIILNGDGARWIQEGVELFPHAHYQLDRFHLRRHLIQAFGHDRDTLRQVVDSVLAGS